MKSGIQHVRQLPAEKCQPKHEKCPIAEHTSALIAVLPDNAARQALDSARFLSVQQAIQFHDYSQPSNSNYGGQSGIGIEIDQKAEFIAKIGSFDSDPDSIIMRIAAFQLL